MTLKMTFSPEHIDYVAQYTADNHHNAARTAIVSVLRDHGVEDDELDTISADYGVVTVTHLMAGHMTPAILRIRNWADDRLKTLLRKRVTNHNEVWGAL